MNYEEWNLVLNQHFFNEEMAGREVLLYANEALIRRLGGSDTSLQDFISAIRQGPAGSTRSSFCQKALQAKEKWEDRSHSFPPYLAYLVFFVVAAGTDEDFADHAFYPRLWRLLGEERSGAPPSFDQMISLWSDLEKWSRADRHEELGRFYAWPRGKWWHVGMPWSQLILSEDERKALPKIFYEAEFDPTAPPATEVLIRDLVAHGQETLRRQTSKLLSSTAVENKVMRDALAEFVIEELSHWTGDILEGSPEEHGSKGTRVQTGLRICLDNIDPLSRTARSYFRFKATRPFPSGGLQFEGGTGGKVWACVETYHGWSSPLKLNSNSGKEQRVDAAALDWKGGLTITDSENGWRARLRGANVRLFHKGTFENLPGWVESHRLQRERDFIVLSLRNFAPEIREWGSAACKSFNTDDLRGLPEGWVAFSGRGAIRSCPNIDVLTLSPTARLSLKDGVKIGRGNTYFDFAPPKISIENYTSFPIVKVDGRPVNPISAGDPTWNLPTKLPVLTPILIEAEECKPPRRFIRLQGPQLSSTWDSVPYRDSTGAISAIGPGAPRAQGASVNGELLLPAGPAKTHLPTYLSTRINFLGRLPGQICEWPDADTPTEWHPAWAVARIDREHWQAHFCGTQDHFSGIPVGSPIPDPPRVKNWKQVLWTLRKVTEPPVLPRVRNLWKAYVEAAENV